MKKHGKVEAVLTLRVLYNLKGADRSRLTGLLRGLAARAAGEGLMTGDTFAEVEEWDESVKWSDQK